MKYGMLLAFMLLLMPITLATSIKDYNIEYNIQENKVIVDYKFSLINHREEIINITLPVDVKAPFVFLDGRILEPQIINDKLQILINENNKDIEVKYITKELLESGRKFYFVDEIKLGYTIEKLNVELKLPEKAVLDTSEPEPSAYPKPTRIESDGKVIILKWEVNDVSEFPIFVVYRSGRNIVLFVILFVVIIVLAVFLIKKPRIIREVKIKRVKTGIEEHLKEEEKQIVAILKRKGGSCEQGTLRLLTDFSKATLSRLLMEMEARNIIKKIKKGKKNIIFLKEDKRNNTEQ